MTPPAAFVLETREDGTPALASPRNNDALKNAATESQGPVDGAWWTAFGDPALNAVIEEALAHNFTFRDLRGLYHEDMLTPNMPNGPLWPLQIGLPAQVQRSRTGVADANNHPYFIANNELDIGVTATYQLDIWGQLDLQKKELEDLALIQGQSAEAGAQNLAVQAAQTWFEILAQRELLDLVQRQVKLNEDLQSLVQARFELHLTTRLAVLQQTQQLLNLRAQVPLIAARIALLNSQLTMLLGRRPDPNSTLVPVDRRMPELPSLGSPGKPVDLVKSSPEVRMAQIRVAEAEHRISQNEVGWLPQLSLFANAGLQSFDLKYPLNFYDQPGGTGETFATWGFGAKLVWPIFDGGQRITERKQLTMTVRRRNMLYQEAFLEAVRRVQDSQIQETKQEANVKTLRSEVELGEKVLSEARGLYEQGLSDYLSVLTAFENLSDLQRTLIQAERFLLSYRIDLYRALGGTWSKAVVEIVE